MHHCRGSLKNQRQKLTVPAPGPYDVFRKCQLPFLLSNWVNQKGQGPGLQLGSKRQITIYVRGVTVLTTLRKATLHDDKIQAHQCCRQLMETQLCLIPLTKLSSAKWFFFKEVSPNMIQDKEKRLKNTTELFVCPLILLKIHCNWGGAKMVV